MDRQILNLNENWKFYLGNEEEAFYKGFDDSNFKDVMLPHDWSVEHGFERKASSGTGYLIGGIAWYRLHFKLPESFKGKHVVLHFDGVYKNAQVWINSYNLGKHPYGYTPFSFDISEFAQFGDVENVVAVKVTHTDLADSRWFTGSGITRKVYVSSEENIYCAEDGTFLETLEADEKEAKVRVYCAVVNETNDKQNVNVKATLSDGQNTFEGVGLVNPECNEGQYALVDIDVKNPKLWSVDEPNLYKLEIELDSKEGKYIGTKLTTGIRTIKFDADKGFFLNGQNIKFKGVCVHHDAGALGAAPTKEIWERRLMKLKECGTNAIRTSHNPHMPELYELCDKMGFLMMDEAFDEWECPKNKWSTGHNVYPPKHQGYAEDFPEWHERDLAAMVCRDRIHPSVVMYSIGNEIDYPNDPYCHPSFDTMTGNNDANKPSRERMYDDNKPNAERMVTIARELVDIVKSEDDTRPVTMALAFPELSDNLGILDCLDVAGYNYKEHLYEADHKRFPDMPFLGSENGHGLKQWEAVKNNDYISGQFLWTGIDYLGEAHGWPIHGSSAGVLDIAAFEKDRFAMRKSFWKDEPMIELYTRKAENVDSDWIEGRKSWNYNDGEEVLVKCYSNLSEVTFYLNDMELGHFEKYNADGFFKIVIPFKAGTLKAVAGEGSKTYEASLSTLSAPTDFSFTMFKDSDFDKENTKVGYIYQIELELIDSNGNLCTFDDRAVNVSVSGSGEFRGLESGNLADNHPYLSGKRLTRNGKILLFVRRTKAGPIAIDIDVEGIRNDCFYIGKNN